MIAPRNSPIAAPKTAHSERQLRVMDEYVEYASRPGNLTLSFVTIMGLGLLAAMLWHVTPGFVLLLMIPALAACTFQMVVTPVYGLRMGRKQWLVLGGETDHAVATADIAYLRVSARGDVSRATLVLRSGEEVDIPVYLTENPLDLIREATNRGIPVRSN